MEWIEVFVATSRIGLEPVEGVLYQCGLTGLMIHDEADFAEFLENPNREWDYVADELVEEKEELETGITFFLRDNLYGREQLAQIQGALAAVKASEKELDLGSLELKMKNVQEEDWANNWKKYFKPFPVGEKIMIKPSWEELTEETDKVILKIDPGHIFGTGTHETTQLCMELIERIPLPQPISRTISSFFTYFSINSMQSCVVSCGIITERKEDVLAALAAGGFDVQDVREKKGWVAIASKYVG